MNPAEMMPNMSVMPNLPVRRRTSPQYMRHLAVSSAKSKVEKTSPLTIKKLKFQIKQRSFGCKVRNITAVQCKKRAERLLEREEKLRNKNKEVREKNAQDQAKLDLMIKQREAAQKVLAEARNPNVHADSTDGSSSE